MKLIRFITSMALVLGLACTCTKFDDSALWQAINKNAADIAALKETTKNLNSDILALQQLVAALQNHDYITNCSPLADGMGYTIAFSSGKSIVIRNGQNGADGKDGKDGTTPQIGIRQHSDGLYYWTLNGEWLLGSDGNMIRAEGKDGKDGVDGKDGITPQMKIEDGCWYLSTDNGNTWTNLGKATGTDGKDGKDGNDGESFFKNVIVGEDSVTFVLSDGTEIFLPLVLEGDIIHVSGISLSKTSVTLVEGSFETITATITPSDAHNQNVLWSCSDTDIATVDANGLITAIKSGTATITAKSQDGDYTATCTVIVIPANPSEPEAVDLGLPSGLKWATCNLGASRPQDYGDHYAWGATEPSLNKFGGYNILNYPFHIDNSEDNIGWTKYIPSDKSSYWSGTGSPDNKTVLDSKDDVAHVKLGGKWRMPSREEFQELDDNCFSQWETLGWVYGMKFTSKKNGNSIFLPATGHRVNNEFYNAGSQGGYWSSSLDTDYPNCAYHFSVKPAYSSVFGYPRDCGLSVRPVSE